MNDLIKLAKEKNITPDQFREAYEADGQTAMCSSDGRDHISWHVVSRDTIAIDMVSSCMEVDLSPKEAIRWATRLLEGARKLQCKLDS